MPAQISRALYDTTAMIDIFKMPSRREYLETLRKKFGLTFATDIVQLEFKAVLIQQMITIHAKLRQRGRFLIVRDELSESTHPQHRLRVHIFNNIICVFPPRRGLDEAGDAKLADKARRLLEVHIPLIYERFHDQIDWTDRKISCTRALEAPRLHRSAFDPNLPICKRGRNKECLIEEFIRQRVVPRLDRLRNIAVVAESEQLQRACELFEQVAGDRDIDLSWSDCRSAGDALIAVAADGYATHVLSTNKREWKPLAAEINAEFFEIEYDKP